MKKILAIILGISLLMVPLVWGFDKIPGSFREFKDWVKGSDAFTPVLSDGWVEVTIIGHGEGLYPDLNKDYQLIFKRASGIFGQSGSGYHIGGGWIMTSAHVVKPSQVVMQLSPSFYYVVAIDRVLTIDYMIGSDRFGKNYASLIWINEEQDLALLWVDLKITPYLKDYGYRTTWTRNMGISYIEEKDAVATIVRVRDEDGNKLWHYEVRYGTVIASKPVLPAEVTPDLLPYFSLYDFTIDIPLWPGDSGSPIFAFDNGKPVIVGLGRASLYKIYDGKYYSYASRVDRIHMKTLERR